MCRFRLDLRGPTVEHARDTPSSPCKESAAMSKMKYGLALVVLGGLLAGAEDEAPKPAEPGTLIVIDSAGREQKIKSYRISVGTRRLGWLAPADKEEENDKDKEEAKGKRPVKKAAGPEALVFRDELKFNFLAGVTTLIPLDRIRSISFDADKSTMTVRAAGGEKPEEDVTLTGTTAYRGINKLTLAAEVDKGDAGVAD